MRFLISIAIVALVFTSIACNSTERRASSSPATSTGSPAKPKPPADGVRRITVAELKGLIDQGQAFVVDVRNEAAYNLAHIPGAVLIPTGQILNRVNELPRNKTIVTYCS